MWHPHTFRTPEGASGSPPPRCELRHTPTQKGNRMQVHAHAPLAVEGRRRFTGWLPPPLTAGSRASGRQRIGERTSLRSSRYRSSRRLRQPRLSDHQLEQRTLEARARTNLEPASLSHTVGGPPSMISRLPRRYGRSREACTPRPITKRHEWAQPETVIHVDTAKVARLDRAGHRTRGRS